MIKVIVTGVTGMVGEGVLHVCLNHPEVEEVLILGRRRYDISHPKVKQIVHENLFDLSGIEDQLSSYDACYFCLGTTSVGVSAEDYFKTTYTLTMHVGEVLSKLNTSMTFCYVSGGGTDSTEKGRLRWARVKGKTENDLMRLPFKQVFAFRPGFIKPIKGLFNTSPYYKYISWMFPIGRIIFPSAFCTMQELGLAMINVTKNGYHTHVIEGKDIIKLGI